MVCLIVALATILNPVPSQAAGDPAAPVAAPRGIPDEVWNGLYKVAFTDGAIPGSNLKWGTQPTLGLLGNPSEEDLMALTNLSSGLKRYCPNLAPSVAKNDSGAGIKMYFVPKSEYTKYIEKAPSDGDSYLYYVYYTSGGLRTVTLVVNSEMSSQAERKNIISLRFLQSLGLMAYSNDSSMKMLSWLYLNDGIYSENDSQVLTLYCSGFVKGGQNFKAVAADLASALNKTPNQAPVFSPTISVDASENNAQVLVSLGSPQNLFSSGEITFEYTVTSGSGEMVDSGEISNSSARVKSDWVFEINNLKPGNSYKFSLTMKNIIGSSKAFATNFKTNGERVSESAQEQFIDERSEQSITLFDIPSSMKLSDQSYTLMISTTSDLEAEVESLTPMNCSVNSYEIKLLKTGQCQLRIYQDGDEEFQPAEDVLASFAIQGTKTSIFCVKGKATKKVTGMNPKCPTGFKIRK